MITETVVSIDDLQYLTIHCKQCGTSMTLDLNYAGADHDRDDMLGVCSICGIPFDSTLRPNVIGFKRAYEALSKHAKVSFRVKAENAIPSKK